jgi:hypothetical protein
MKKQGNVDHQVRRSYLEIICIKIANEDYIKLDEILQQFVEDAGGSSSDEYRIAIEIKEAIDAKDFAKLQTVSKKPIFTFLETEIVKAFKKAILNPPALMSGGGPIIGATGKNEEKS